MCFFQINMDRKIKKTIRIFVCGILNSSLIVVNMEKSIETWSRKIFLLEEKVIYFGKTLWPSG